jgi:putative peptidoglycan lipid II flippase
MGRFQSVVARANKRLTLQLAAALLAGSTLLSSLLGLFRDRLLNAKYFEAFPQAIDAYTVAFTVPDFMYFILVSGALSVTFIPVFNQRLASGNKKSAWELSTSILNLMALATLAASILIMIFAEPLVAYVVGPGLDEAGRNLAVSLMRVVAINPFLFAVATVISSMQQAVGRFSFFALAPTIYNVGIIIGITVFTNGINLFGWQVFDGGIMGVALGVVLGSILQLLVSTIGLLGMGFDYRFAIYWRNKGFRKVLGLLPARSLDQGIDYVNSIVETNLTSRMAAGTVRAYQQAMTLHMVPINLIGVAISTAAFPKMSERLTQGRPDLFKKEFQTILRVIVWLALPVSAITFFTRGYLANFVSNGGTSRISDILGVLAIAILFRSIFHIASRSFYAQQDTKTPLYISLASVGLNVVLSILFAFVFHRGAMGVALASSIAAILEVIILFSIMARRIKGLFDAVFIHAVARMLSATGFMMIVTYIFVLLMPLSGGEQSFFTTFPSFAVIAGVSMVVYVAICRCMKLEEADPLITAATRMLFGRMKR